MQHPSTAARNYTATRLSPSRASSVAASAVKRARQYVARKELQKAAKHEYLKQFYESADRVEADHLVFELKPNSPRLRAQQQQYAQNAELNRQLAQQIPQLQDWQQLQDFLHQHSSTLNFLAIVALTNQAATVHQLSGPPPQECSGLLHELAAIILQASSWFQPAHFAATATATCSCGMSDAMFWDNLVAAAEHKVGACSFQQLTQIVVALATVGFVPDLQWVERCYRQASKHLHAADAADICSLIWAWGEWGYTPRDRLFLNQVKILTRRAFDEHQLSALRLVQLMHGLARMPKYAPNHGWMMALAKEAQRQMQQLSPGDIVDMLLSFAALGFQPQDAWMKAALTHLQDGFSPSISNTSGPAQQVLLLPPPDLQQQFWNSMGPAGILEPGVLVQQHAEPNTATGVDGPTSEDVQQLQEIFAAAAVTDDEHAGARAAQPVQAATTTAVQQQADVQQDVVNYIASAAVQHQHELRQYSSTEQLGILCWVLGRYTYQPSPQWMQQLGQQLLLHCHQASAEVVVDALSASVALGYLPLGQVQEMLLSRALECIYTMQAEPLRRLCKALVGLEQGLEASAAELMVFTPHMRQSAGFQDGQQHSRNPAAAAFAALQLYQQQFKGQLAEAVVDRQGSILWQSSTQQLADVLAYVAASGVKPDADYMAKAVSKAVEKLPEGAPTASVAVLLWALARIGFKPNPQLLHQLLAAVQRGLHLLSGQDLADVGWALCTLKHRPGATWLSLYMQQVVSKVAYMSEQALTDTVWALACFAAQPDREWLKTVLLAAGDVQLSSRNAAVLMWALQQLGFSPQAEGWGLEQVGGGSAVEKAVLGLMQAVLQPQQDKQLLTAA